MAIVAVASAMALTLCEEGQTLKVEIGVIIDHLSNPSADILHLNVTLSSKST